MMIRSDSVNEIYAELLAQVRYKGTRKKDRTSVGGNISVFGAAYTQRFATPQKDGTLKFPLMTLRAFSPRIAFEELMWMLRGQTDVGVLQKKNIRIWDGNSSLDFLQKSGKSHIDPNTIGKGYGYQMRNFNGVDQLVECFNSLRDDPFGRRHLISFWNPSDLNDMALPPCHLLYTFNCMPNPSGGITLNLHMNMRSNDIYHGMPYNHAFSSMWLLFFSKALGYKMGELFVTITDAHIYDNARAASIAVIDRFYDGGLSTPTLTIIKDLTSLDDILDLDYKDLIIENFAPYSNPCKVGMAL